MISKFDGNNTLLVTTVIPSRSEQMKSTRTSDFAFLRFLLRLVIWIEEFFINLMIFSLPIRIMTCFLDGPLVVIWMWGFGLEGPLTMLLIWSIFSALIDGKVFLILMTSNMLVFYLESWAYDLALDEKKLFVLLLLKNLEIMLISF